MAYDLLRQCLVLFTTTMALTTANQREHKLFNAEDLFPAVALDRVPNKPVPYFHREHPEDDTKRPAILDEEMAELSKQEESLTEPFDTKNKVKKTSLHFYYKSRDKRSSRDNERRQHRIERKRYENGMNKHTVYRENDEEPIEGGLQNSHKYNRHTSKNHHSRAPIQHKRKKLKKQHKAHANYRRNWTSRRGKKIDDTDDESEDKRAKGILYGGIPDDYEKRERVELIKHLVNNAFKKKEEEEENDKKPTSYGNLTQHQLLKTKNVTKLLKPGQLKARIINLRENLISTDKIIRELIGFIDENHMVKSSPGYVDNLHNPRVQQKRKHKNVHMKEYRRTRDENDDDDD